VSPHDESKGTGTSKTRKPVPFDFRQLPARRFGSNAVKPGRGPRDHGCTPPYFLLTGLGRTLKTCNWNAKPAARRVSVSAVTREWHGRTGVETAGPVAASPGRSTAACCKFEQGQVGPGTLGGPDRPPSFAVARPGWCETPTCPVTMFGEQTPRRGRGRRRQRGNAVGFIRTAGRPYRGPLTDGSSRCKRVVPADPCRGIGGS